MLNLTLMKNTVNFLLTHGIWDVKSYNLLLFGILFRLLLFSFMVRLDIVQYNFLIEEATVFHAVWICNAVSSFIIDC